jgi:hypothetical protein
MKGMPTQNQPQNKRNNESSTFITKWYVPVILKLATVYLFVVYFTTFSFSATKNIIASNDRAIR